MKKLLLLFLLAFLAVPIANAEESVVTLTTTLDEGASIKLYTWADSMDDAFTIDWGDGVEKIYNKVKPSWTYGSEITGKLGASKTITIKGMMCAHCSGRVESALNELAGVTARVDLEKKTATVTAGAEVSDDALRKAVEDAGYKVTGIR